MRLIDDLKHEVPIWKHQVFSDGEEEWVGMRRLLTHPETADAQARRAFTRTGPGRLPRILPGSEPIGRAVTRTAPPAFSGGVVSLLIDTTSWEY